MSESRTKTVPLYDCTGGKKVLIGEAEVEEFDGELIVKGQVSKEFSHLYGVSIGGVLPDFPDAYIPLNNKE